MKNRLGIVNDPEALKAFEREATASRAETIHETVSGNFDEAHLRALHQHLFQDVYEWAGTTRQDTIQLDGETVHVPSVAGSLSKGGTTFMPSAFLGIGLAEVARLADREEAMSGDPEVFADAATEVLDSLNHAHPFREGNGRTQRAFLEQLAERAGHTLDFNGITEERNVQASIEAHNGDAEALRDIVAESLDPDRVALRVEAIAAFERSGLNVQEFWVETPAPGEPVTGQLLRSVENHGSVLSHDNRIFVVPGEAIPEGVKVREPVAISVETYSREAESPTDSLRDV